MLVALGQLTADSSYDDVAQVIIGEAVRRGYDPVPPLATAIQESSLRPGAVSSNGLWKNIYQQDASYPGRDNPNTAISGFFDRLDAKRLTDGWNVDLWLNIFWLQQRPGEPSAADAYANGRQAYLAEIKSRTAEAQRLVALYADGADVPMLAPIYDYGITKVMHGYNADTCEACTGNSNGPRSRTLYIVIHTQEGDGTAVSLANYLNSAKVSYNFTVDEKDTVEVVPVGEAPWAAVDANDIGVHLCFAGSRVAWSTDTWLAHGAALDRAAKVVAAACLQYDIPPVKVLSTGGWPVTPKGIAGHADFGRRGGGHTDPEPNFPWENFVGRVKNQIALMTGGAGEIVPPVDGGSETAPGQPTDPAFEIMAQVRGRWEMLGWQTLVEVFAELRDASLGTKDAGKKGFRW